MKTVRQYVGRKWTMWVGTQSVETSKPKRFALTRKPTAASVIALSAGGKTACLDWRAPNMRGEIIAKNGKLLCDITQVAGVPE